MFAGGVPAWHKLGVVVPEEVVTAAEALTLAGLDWDVELKPVYITNPWTTAPVATVVVPDKYAVVRTTDNAPLGVVGKRYTPIQNREAFAFVDALVDSGEAKYDTAGSLAGGKRTFLIAKTNKEILVGGEPSETIWPYLFFRNTHDGTSAVEVLWTKIRVVCANTENFALRQAQSSYRIRHTASWQSKLMEARKVLDISFAHDEEFERLANELITTPHSTGHQLDRFLKQLIPDPKHGAHKTERGLDRRINDRQEIKTLLLTEPNLQNIASTSWGVLNAVTQWADWSRPVKGNGENRLNRILEDTSVKTRALELLTL